MTYILLIKIGCSHSKSRETIPLKKFCSRDQIHADFGGTRLEVVKVQEIFDSQVRNVTITHSWAPLTENLAGEKR